MAEKVKSTSMDEDEALREWRTRQEAERERIKTLEFNPAPPARPPKKPALRAPPALPEAPPPFRDEFNHIHRATPLSHPLPYDLQSINKPPLPSPSPSPPPPALPSRVGSSPNGAGAGGGAELRMPPPTPPKSSGIRSKVGEDER